MVTPAQLTSWRPERLLEIADEITDRRRALTRLSDDLDAAAPPSSWTFASAEAAAAAHGRLVRRLATQVSETVAVIAALDEAAAEIRSAKDRLAGAFHTASVHDLAVDRTTGAVRVTRSYETTSDAAYAATTANQVRQQIRDALAAAEAADATLAGVLRTAATTDVNRVGTLAEQREIADFQALTPAEQADYLLRHPDAFDLLGEHASPAARQLLGERLATELGGLAGDTSALADAERVQRCTDLLDAFGGDAEVMAAVYTELEPEGLLATFGGITSMAYVGANVDELLTLAGGLRSGLQVATQHPGFPGEAYGRELVRYATYDVTDDERRALQDTYGYESTGNAAVLDFLLREGDYGEGFVRGVAWQLDTFERGNPFGAATWTHHDSFANPLNSVDGGGYAFQPDPMAAVMGQLGKHPGLGLEFFTSGEAGAERSEFYFAERDWSRDGFTGIAEAALAIGTSPENLAGSPQETAMFVSEYFDRLPDNPEFDAGNASGAAEPVADLLKQYMPAVEAAAGGDAADHGARVRPLDTSAYLPQIEHYPVLDKADLDGLLEVALSTDDGVARIAEGVAGFRQEQLGRFAGLHPDGAATDNAALQSILDRSAKLEGYMQHAVGDVAIEDAKSRDQQVAVFTTLVSEAVGLVPVPGTDALGDAVGNVAKDAWSAAWNEVAEVPGDTITQAFGSNADAVRDQMTGEAMLGREKAVINTYLSLVQAGVVDVPPSMTDTWTPGGRLVSLGDIPAQDLQTFRAEAMDAMGTVVSATQLEVLYKDPFTDWHGQ